MTLSFQQDTYQDPTFSSHPREESLSMGPPWLSVGPLPGPAVWLHKCPSILSSEAPAASFLPQQVTPS
jgi:hypothetical protein